MARIRKLFSDSIPLRHFGFRLVGVLLIAFEARASINTENLAIAAEYYHKRYDYQQALQLWTEIYQKAPSYPQAIFRITELRLLTEGRIAATESVVQHLRKQSDDRRKDQILSRLIALLETFLVEEGQTLYLQALPKIQHGDYSGALGLLQQAATIEKGNLLVLKEKAKCEKRLSLFDKYYATLKLIRELTPNLDVMTEELVEAHLQYFAYDSILKEVEILPYHNMARRLRLASALARLEKSRAGDCLKEFQQLISEVGWTADEFAVIQFGLGKSMLARSNLKEAGLIALKEFLNSVPKRTSLSTPPLWNPLHLELRYAEAEKIILESKRAVSP